MVDPESLHHRDGGSYVGTAATGGAWDPRSQAGGAVLSLLGHVLEDVPTLTAMSLTRLTVDIVRPVPIGQRLDVTTEVLREVKKIQLVDLAITAGDLTFTRARALRIRDRDVTTHVGIPASTTTANPSTAIPPPAALDGVDEHPGAPAFLRLGAEMRRTREPVDGVHAVWCRLRLPVIADEPVRSSSLAGLPLDIVNLIGAHPDPRRATSINPDVSGHLSRRPAGEWVAITGDTHYSHGVGHGVSIGLLSDQTGTFGVASTSQILEPVIDGS